MIKAYQGTWYDTGKDEHLRSQRLDNSPQRMQLVPDSMLHAAGVQALIRAIDNFIRSGSLVLVQVTKR